MTYKRTGPDAQREDGAGAAALQHGPGAVEVEHQPQCMAHSMMQTVHSIEGERAAYGKQPGWPGTPGGAGPPADHG